MRDGLYRYDGLNLERMNPEIDGMPVLKIVRIEFDEGGGLWALSEHYLHYRESKTGKWGDPVKQPPQEVRQGIYDIAVTVLTN